MKPETSENLTPHVLGAMVDKIMAHPEAKQILLAAAMIISSPSYAAGTVDPNKPQAGPQITTVMEAKEVLWPLVKILRDSKDPAQQIAASQAILAAQKRINNLFGQGAEFTIDFEHQGQRYENVPIDCDAAFITFAANGYFKAYVTHAMLHSMHGILNADMAPSNDPKIQMTETALAKDGLGFRLPIDHEESRFYTEHVFAPRPGENYKSFHNVDKAVINQIMQKMKPYVDHLNETLRAELERPVNNAPAPTL